MDKAEAKRVAYEIASSWIEGQLDAGAAQHACESHNITNEKDQERITEALKEVSQSLMHRATAERLSFKKAPR